MRSKAAKLVRRTIEPHLLEWSFHPARQVGLPTGCHVYRRRARVGFAFVLLQFHRQEDWFTLEIGHGPDPEWSRLRPKMSVPDGVDDGVCFRVCRFWERQMDPWWELAPRPRSVEDVFLRRPDDEAVLGKVPDVVQAAIGTLRQHALPYLLRRGYGPL